MIHLLVGEFVHWARSRHRSSALEARLRTTHLGRLLLPLIVGRRRLPERLLRLLLLRVGHGGPGTAGDGHGTSDLGRTERRSQLQGLRRLLLLLHCTGDLTGELLWLSGLLL